MASQGGLIVGRPPNFLMRNRGGAHSLYDSVFQVFLSENSFKNILSIPFSLSVHVRCLRSIQHSQGSHQIYNAQIGTFVRSLIILSSTNTNEQPLFDKQVQNAMAGTPAAYGPRLWYFCERPRVGR
jgi:hypothetical protein